ncbi:hypothetical protein PFF91_06240 [Burkholderia cenocepacia]|uniref:hypothetical protein n=1 Tax=Burkholderia cenocepacia TaxID=95486 RepID=UPI001B9B913F|nr:hypothetical protein [Burkholderia cenocepacia]MBR8096727.1 hypothetical protein [Burkholderia cenocepacia]MDA3665598.1 hypothetical protein [Burkholderia cenocepacia]MDA3678024.1 hypothetical protein [Burkholderia cenocepacia]MDA3682658.1 hypothetical protein [Burkholderia cenocepacia]MDA3690585.1 hypothetical protein [Burkholderia cenocepacia]
MNRNERRAMAKLAKRPMTVEQRKAAFNAMTDPTAKRRKMDMLNASADKAANRFAGTK